MNQWEGELFQSGKCENGREDCFPLQVFWGINDKWLKMTSRFRNLFKGWKVTRKNNGHSAEQSLIDTANDLKSYVGNVTSLYVSGSADGETDFFLFAVDSLSV